MGHGRGSGRRSGRGAGGLVGRGDGSPLVRASVAIGVGCRAMAWRSGSTVVPSAPAAVRVRWKVSSSDRGWAGLTAFRPASSLFRRVTRGDGDVHLRSGEDHVGGKGWEPDLVQFVVRGLVLGLIRSSLFRGRGATGSPTNSVRHPACRVGKRAEGSRIEKECVPEGTRNGPGTRYVVFRTC